MPEPFRRRIKAVTGIGIVLLASNEAIDRIVPLMLLGAVRKGNIDPASWIIGSREMRLNRRRLWRPIPEEIQTRASSAIRTSIQSINATQRTRAAWRRSARIHQDFAIPSDEERNILAAGNASIGRQRLQQIEIEVLRITTESLLEVGHERLCVRQIEIASTRFGVTLHIGQPGL
jgi:hypothetical protein